MIATFHTQKGYSSFIGVGGKRPSQRLQKCVGCCSNICKCWLCKYSSYRMSTTHASITHTHSPFLSVHASMTPPAFWSKFMKKDYMVSLTEYSGCSFTLMYIPGRHRTSFIFITIKLYCTFRWLNTCKKTGNPHLGITLPILGKASVFLLVI